MNEAPTLEGEPEPKRPCVEPAGAAAEVGAEAEVEAKTTAKAETEVEAEAETEAVVGEVAPVPAVDAAQGSSEVDTVAAVAAVAGQDPVSGNDGLGSQPGADSTAGRSTGTVKQWRDEKGFGFIVADDGSEDLFVHRTSLQEGDCLVEGAKVSYVQGVDDRKGKAQALDVSGGVTRSAQPNGALSMPGAPFAAGSASMAAAPGALMGTAKSWHPDKRFGFIKPDDGSEDVFVHRSSIQGAEMLQVGARVRYTKVADGARAKAQDVVLMNPPPFGGGGYGGGGYGGGGYGGGAPPHYAPPPPYGSYAPQHYAGAPPYPHASPGYHHGPPGYPAQHQGQHPGYANQPGAYGHPYGGYAPPPNSHADYWPPS